MFLTFLPLSPFFGCARDLSLFLLIPWTLAAWLSLDPRPSLSMTGPLQPISFFDFSSNWAENSGGGFYQNTSSESFFDKSISTEVNLTFSGEPLRSIWSTLA